jgi:hypothetical protein
MFEGEGKKRFHRGRARLSVQEKGAHYWVVNNFPIRKELDIIAYSMKCKRKLNIYFVRLWSLNHRLASTELTFPQ